MPPSYIQLADTIEIVAHDVMRAAQEFKNDPTVTAFGRILGALAQLTTIIKAYKRPMREWLVIKDEKAKRR